MYCVYMQCITAKTMFANFKSRHYNKLQYYTYDVCIVTMLKLINGKETCHLYNQVYIATVIAEIRFIALKQQKSK